MEIKRTWIDSDKCGAFQLCIGGAPNLFRETEGTASEIIATSKYTKDEIKALISSAWSCPLGAIYIELSTGEILNEITNEEYARYVESS